MKSLFNFLRRKPTAHFDFLADTSVPLQYRILYLSLDETAKRKVEQLWRDDKVIHKFY